MTHSESVFPPHAPVSRALERELRAKLRSGLQVWLDKEERYSGFVDRLREAEGDGAFVPVVAYRGSFLQMLEDLRGKTADAVQSPPLLVHMPGFNSEEIRATPVLGYYHAGKRYERKLETLVENAAAGLIDPDDIRAYVDGGVTTLEAADAWLAEKLGAQGNQLEALQLPEIWERLAGYKDRAALGEDPEEVRAHLKVRVAMDGTWLEATALDALFDRSTDTGRKFDILGDILLSWAMAVEFVNDLRRPPKMELLAELPGLNAVYVDACRDLARHVRSVPAYQSAYMRVANDFAGKLQAEADDATAADLGDVDTFLFEDDLIMVESLTRLIDGDAGGVLEWANKRREEDSVWLRADRTRSRVWELVRAGARLDAALAEQPEPLKGAYSADEALGSYKRDLWVVDQRHRHLEQKRRLLLSAEMPHFGRVREMLDALRARYHTWGNAAADRFADICVKQGFLPSDDRRQRHIFEQEVRPKVNDSADRLAYVLLDGFRFEMAKELVDRLGTAGLEQRLEARLAELPSITSIGMNLLAPVASGGRMTPVLAKKGSVTKVGGFQLGSYRVKDPETRRRAMSERVKGTNCPLMSLDEVLDSTNLKGSLQGFGLAVVHSVDLDEAGEVGQGTAAFDNILMRVASAIRQLRRAGIQRFVITADHGFLVEPPTETVDASGSFAARYRFDEQGMSGKDAVAVRMSDLGYDDTTLYAVFPRTTRCYAVPGGTRNYVHGGNSLQERVIPVLSLDFRRKSGGGTEASRLTIEGTRQEVPGGGNRVAVRLRRQQGALNFATAETFELTLQPVEDDLELEVTDIRAGAELVSEQTIQVKPGGMYEVDFVVRGANDGRCKVRVVALGRQEQIRPVELESLFRVTGTARGVDDDETPAHEPESESNWAAIEDEGARRVLEFLSKHGSVTEKDATRVLGGGRQFRRFSRQVAQWSEFLAFGIRVESSAAGKRYVKE